MKLDIRKIYDDGQVIIAGAFGGILGTVFSAYANKQDRTMGDLLLFMSFFIVVWIAYTLIRVFFGLSADVYNGAERRGKKGNKFDDGVTTKRSRTVILMWSFIITISIFTYIYLENTELKMKAVEVSFIVGAFLIAFGKTTIAESPEGGNLTGEHFGYVTVFSALMMALGSIGIFFELTNIFILVTKSLFAIGFGLFSTILLRISLGSNAINPLICLLVGRTNFSSNKKRLILITIIAAFVFFFIAIDALLGII